MKEPLKGRNKERLQYRVAMKHSATLGDTRRHSAAVGGARRAVCNGTPEHSAAVKTCRPIVYHAAVAFELG